MSRWGAILLGILAALLIIPLLIPIPPLQDTVPPYALADSDSRFGSLNGLDVHYQLYGEGRPAMVLLHGFGASVFSWREVTHPLSAHGTIVAFDRPAFGLTSRPRQERWDGKNPYSPEAAADITIALMDTLSIEEAILVGHSAGGAIAIETALRHPERIQAMILVAPAVYEGGTPSFLRPLLHLPQIRRLGPLFVRAVVSRLGTNFLRNAWYDPTQITPKIVEGYKQPLSAQNWDRALWELTLASRPVDASRLSEIEIPTLIITGDSDAVVDPANSIRLAKELPNAQWILIPECGHLPHEERPDAFVQAVEAFLDDLY